MLLLRPYADEKCKLGIVLGHAKSTARHAPSTGRANARPMTGSGGASSTPRLRDEISAASGIPVKPDDDRCYSLRAQRVGIFHHIRSAAAGGARGEQHESLGGEHPAWEITADRKIVGDVLARGVV